VIQGNVNDDDQPIIELQIGGRTWPALVDTGFNGDIELPIDLFDDLSPRFVGTVTSQLGGGQSVTEDAYLVEIPFDGETIQVEATFVAGDTALIGTQMLPSHRLEINFPQSSVLLERV
jgi:predicted aspartyl protease